MDHQGYEAITIVVTTIAMMRWIHTYIHTYIYIYYVNNGIWWVYIQWHADDDDDDDHRGGGDGKGDVMAFDEWKVLLNIKSWNPVD